jgi:hypothetical protein
MQDAGLTCEKLSAMYKTTHDIKLAMLGRDAKMEIKCRAKGFATIYKWLEPVDLLVIKRDRSEALVVLPMKTLVELIKGEGNERRTRKSTQR